jgi:hypothetical protein
VIPDWTALSLWSSVCAWPVVLVALLAASPALIRFNDWRVVSRAAQLESSVDSLEALFALEDDRAIGHSQPWRQR